MSSPNVHQSLFDTGTSLTEVLSTTEEIISDVNAGKGNSPGRYTIVNHSAVNGVISYTHLVNRGAFIFTERGKIGLLAPSSSQFGVPQKCIIEIDHLISTMEDGIIPDDAWFQFSTVNDCFGLEHRDVSRIAEIVNFMRNNSGQSLNM